MGGSIQRSRGKAAYRRAVDAANKKPINSVLPVISGTKTQGQTLTCSSGTWTNSPTYAYQWNRGGVAIAGATASTRVLLLADVGSTMTCTVTATNAGVSTAATSLPTTAIVGS
jgi:hypothetical protein